MNASFLKNYLFDLLLLLLLGIFIAFKIQDLSIPYFWDELGVYAPGALKMIDEGTIGLLPSALEPLYSRGHPLLFVFCQAVWMSIFGDGVIGGHSFSLFLGVLTLIVSYFCARDLFNKKVAFFSTVLLAVQPIFYAMSGVILPEMMLTLFMVPAVWAIIQKRWLAYFIFASCAILTKEFAIILPALAFVVVLMDAYKSKDYFTTSRLKQFIFSIFPLFVFAGFLIIQKIQNGWYFFPLHIELMHLGGLPDHLLTVCKDLFMTQGRWILTLFILFGLFHFFRKFPRSIYQNRTYFVIGLFWMFSIAFAVLNFYLLRYMLIILPFITMIAVAELELLTALIKKRWQLPLFTFVCFLACFLSLRTMDPKVFNDTSDMSYIHIVQLEKEVIEWVEQQAWSKEKIEANFPIFQGISDRRYGYLTGEPIPYVSGDERASYGVLFHLDKDEIPVWDNRAYTVLKEFKGMSCSILIVHFP